MNFKLQNICVAMNFSQCALNALRIALLIAAENKAKLHIVHVTKAMDLHQFANVNRKVIGMLKDSVESVRKALNENSEIIIDILSLEINYEVKMGPIGKKIREFEMTEEIDLTIIGTHGIYGLKEMIAGTTAMEILKYTSRPVITIPKEFKKKRFESVLYPIRNILGTSEKFQYLTSFFETNNLRIHLLTIYSINNEKDAYALTNKMKELRDSIRDKAVKVSFETISSKSVSQTIVEVANKIDCDLIIINATMNRKYYEIFSSHGYTNRLINDSIFPMLCVKPELIFPGSATITGSGTNSFFSFVN